MSLNALINAMSHLLALSLAYFQGASTTSSLRSVLPDSSTSDEPNMPTDFDFSDPKRLCEAICKVKSKFPPLEMLPCANVHAAKFKVCPKQGTKSCSACKLVSYCSKECQENHWPIHKQDCKNPLKSSNWKPAWVIESRLPTSFVSESGNSLLAADEFGTGLSFWGNMPAIDLINIAKNEKDASQDLSIALVASGDLRHVVQTVNALPHDYSGHLQVLINDGCLPVVARNIAILLILGTVSDEKMAADIALHFWYSVFLPAEYGTRIMGIVTSFLCREDPQPQPLGPRSSMDCLFPPEALLLFRRFGSLSFSMADAQNEYDRVRNASSRRDFRDRMYAKLKPSHRVAFQEFRRFGIVLPFGALNAHFNVPNASLFSPGGKWLQTDYADPLEGWDIGPILDAGRAHGAQPEDVYGCLYFFLSDQLRTFARRLREFRISFRVVTTDASHLSRIIREGVLSSLGIPASVRFDRIDVSNILDVNYIGIRDVLTHWGPLLKDNRTAALVGYFMNWTFLQHDGSALSAGRIDLIDEFVEKGRFPGIGPGGRISDISDPRELQTGMLLIANHLNTAYDNSNAFSQFLKQQNLENLLCKTKLKLRKTRTIVPHRHRVPLDAAPNAVPDFTDDEIWYNYTQLQSFTWTERFVEFGRV